jgi:hypothetical protein
VNRFLSAGVVAAAAFAAVAPMPPETVERVYSTWAYPAIQRALTPLANQVPIALFDVLIAVAIILVAAILVAGVRGAWRARRLAPLGRTTVRLLVMAAGVYLTFLALWGLNYRRIPMTERLVLRERADSEAVLALGRESVDQLNGLYASAHEAGWRAGEEWTDTSLRQAFVSVQRALADGSPAEPGRLKSTMLGPYFRGAGVDGMINPFGLEVLVNPDLLPFERPFVAAHEWAHLAGYADESEASFVGVLTCLRAGVGAQYSGWLFLYWQVSAEIGARERERLAAPLADGPRRDLIAIVERLQRGQWPALQRAGWVVYDQYLKANRVEEGIRSYGAVLTLLARAGFDADWQPVRRGGVSR